MSYPHTRFDFIGLVTYTYPDPTFRTFWHVVLWLLLLNTHYRKTPLKEEMGRVIIIKKNVIRALLSMFNIGLINLFSFCYHNYLHSPKPSTYLKSFRFSSKSVTPSTPHLTSKSNVTKLNVNPTRSLSPVQGRTLWYRRKSDLETFSGE